jgi:diguanylate cyclase (GGDEF)-like protein
MEEMMSARVALPGVVTGCIALLAGLVAFAFDVPALAVVAGLLGLGAGLAALRPVRQLEEHAAATRRLEDELDTVRRRSDESEQRLRRQLAESSDQARRRDAADAMDVLTDPVTGLFSQSFFQVALDSRIAAARRHLRPVAVVLLDVVEGVNQGQPSQAGPHVVAEGIRMTLREADTACRLRNGQFALLLEDTPENGAIWTVERIRRRLVSLQPGLTMWAGVACYPAHAFNAEEIVGAADVALTAAREWRQDRIEVATTAAD